MDEISTGISRRGFVLGGVTAGVAAMAAGGLDTSIVGLIRGYACRRGSNFFMSCSYRLVRRRSRHARRKTDETEGPAVATRCAGAFCATGEY